MSAIVEKLLNRNLAELTPYESARRLFSGGQDWLNANESPYNNIYQLDDSTLNRYPACQPEDVVQRYASYANVSSDQVLVSRGADEGIELLIRAFCQPGRDNILICPPTYGMYAISAQTNNVGVQSVPLKNDFSLDVDAVCQSQNVNLVFICAPNNPTGTQVAREDIKTVLEAMADKALVVVDEAYIEFDAHNTWATELAHYPNLVILRTLSKAFALAGLRCGFTLAQPAVIQALLKVIAPYPIPEPVAQIAEQALSIEALPRLYDQVGQINAEKQRLTESLAGLQNVEIVGAQYANFVLFSHPLAKELMQYLVASGMLIRDQSKQLGLQNCLRVTVGTPEQNQRLIALTNEFLNEVAQ
ncbi:histidinol-phosphate transaminase [Alteromonas halophila]|uniref:Histidinol-phosphate aminotransferase n=1 Tax=Alteromonas halophila TaxID=516698 RepID=A0A918JPC1_9ALTE|nr:histidinol-phosphate transaminase [Alteromonas halophila]GGW94730.1 histidinol-phosphate aminotransferase [Alteromonas halophila]